jgi:predicted Zn-dependent peptidase
MITVKGPDGATIQFPDDTPRDTITGIMRQRYGGPDPTTTGSTVSKSEGEPAPAAVNPGTLAGFKVLLDRGARDEVIQKYAETRGVKPADLYAAAGNIVPSVNKASRLEPAVAPGGWMDTATDIGRSAVSGIGQGALAVAGLPGDIKGGVDWLMNKVLPMTPEQQAQYAGANTLVPPSTAELRGKVQEVTGPFYRPKSTAGRYAESIGEFAPAAITGPGGVVRKAAMAVAPGLLTEGAQDVTAGTAAEVPATIAAGVLGGGIGALAGRGSSLTRAVKTLVPDVEKGYEQVASKTKQLYDDLRSKGIKYDANAWDSFATETAHDLRTEGFRARQAPKAHDIIDEMHSMVGKSPDYNDVESLRKAAGNLARQSIEPTEQAMGRILVRKLDKFTEASPFMTTTGETTPQIQAQMRAAREMASRKIKAEQLMTARDMAQNYVSGEASGLRNQFTAMGRRIAKKKGAGFSPVEQQAIAAVSQGTIPQRALSTLGTTGVDVARTSGRSNLLPFGVGGATAAGGALFGPVGAVMAPLAQQGVAIAAKQMALASTKRAAENAIRIMLAGRGAQTDAVRQRVQDIIRLMASQGINLDISVNRPPR